jgi:Holliday junction resolvase RusA-like endonuclease
MKFVVEGKIKGKARPRWSSKSASMYTPLETKQYENYIAHCFRIAGGEKIEGAVVLNITMLFAIPKNTKKSNRELYRLNKVLPTKKPDIDNCLKAVMDGLNKVAYEDDKQVVENHIIKRWTTGVERLEIEIVEAEGDEEYVYFFG